MRTIGRHLIGEFYDCARDIIDDPAAVRGQLRVAAAAVGATVVGELVHRYEPHGVSGVLLIAESHVSVHTWPEVGYVAVDIYTCGGLDPRPGFRAFGEGLRASSSRMQEILRGVPDELETGRSLLPDDVQIITRMVPAEPGPAS